MYIYMWLLLAKFLMLVFSNGFNNTMYLSCYFNNFQRCEICREQFEQYWDEEEEEWHLKNAIRMHEKVIQSCYVALIYIKKQNKSVREELQK